MVRHDTKQARSRSDDRNGSVLIYAHDPSVVAWIEHELFGEAVSMRIAANPAEVISALTSDPRPRAQILILDVAALKPQDGSALASIRGAGWPGVVIAIGEASDQLRRALDIDRVLPLPLRAESLRTIVRGGSDRPTAPLIKLEQ